MRCGHCGAAAADDARFCSQCGSRLGEAEDAELRQITSLFCDLVGSTELSARLDPEEFAELLRRYHEVAVDAVARYEAEVARYVGDGMLVLFGWPRAHGDDPERAVRAGLDVAAAVQRLDAEMPAGLSLAVRVGIDTGVAVVGSVGSAPEMALGRTLNVAARLQEVAAPGTVVLSEATHRLVLGLFLVEDLGQHRLKGLDEPVHAYRAVQASGIRGRLAAREQRLTPRVNREAELGLLNGLWERVLAGHGQTVLIRGEPGIGKSRLVLELQGHIRQPHTWLECGCSSYSRHSAFRPLIDVITTALGLREDDSSGERGERIGVALRRLGIDDPVGAELLAELLAGGQGDPAEREMSPGVHRRRLLDLYTRWALTLAQQQATILLIEDLQWADPSSLELFDRLLEESACRRLLLLGTARPEFDADWPSRSNLSRIELAPLPEAHVRELVDAVSTERKLAPGVIDRVVTTTDGIPLFTEELTRTLLESERLAAREGVEDRVATAPAPDIPATLYDSLMARLDRLSAAKRVAQRVAVIGREFDRELAEEVAGLPGDVIASGLERLVEDDLLVRRGGAAEGRYSFRHALVQDAAYGSLLKRQRRELHAAVARALQRRRDQGDESIPAETIAKQYEAAGQLDQAVLRFRDAAGEAVRQSAHREALVHLERAIALIGELALDPSLQALEADLQAGVGSSTIALRGYGDPAVERAYERARALYEQLGDHRQVGYTLAGLSLFYFNHGEVERGAELAERALALAGQAGDDSLLVLAGVQFAVPTFYQGGFNAALATLEEVTAAYDPGRHRWLGNRFGVDQGVAAHCFAALSLMRTGKPDSALARVRSAVQLARELADPYALAFALFFETGVLWNRGDVAEQKARAIETLAIAQEQEFELLIGLAQLASGAASAFATGDPATLADVYAGSAMAAGTGFRGGLPAFVCLVAEAQRATGLIAEAVGTVEAGLVTARETAQRYWDAELHRLKGELLIELGEVDRGRAELWEAVAVARAQEANWPLLRAAVALARRREVDDQQAAVMSLLRECHRGFSEGLSTATLIEAGQLLSGAPALQT